MQEPLINIGDGIVIAGYLFAGLGIRLAGTCKVDVCARAVPFEGIAMESPAPRLLIFD